MVRLHFRSQQDSRRAEALIKAVGTYTSLPGGAIAIAEELLPQVEHVLRHAGIEFRTEPVEEYLAGRVPEEDLAD